MKKTRNANFIFSLFFAVLGILAVTATTFAVLLFSFRTGGEIGGNAENVKETVSIAAEDVSLSFSASGERKEVPLSISNSSAANLAYEFTLSLQGETDAETEKFASAILVYLDGNFIGTLAEISNSSKRFTSGGLLMAKSATARTESHTLALELHVAADKSAWNKNYTAKLTTYVKNADYGNYIFVSDEAGLKKAAADVNSGLLENTQTVVLASDLTMGADVAFTRPVKIDLAGNRLLFSAGANLIFGGEGDAYLTSSRAMKSADLSEFTGAVVVNGEKTVLHIADFYAETTGTLSETPDEGQNVGSLYAALVTLTSYDQTAAAAAMMQRAEERFPAGFSAGKSVYPFGAMAFYGKSLHVSAPAGCTYGSASGALSVPQISVSRVETLSAGAASADFRLIANADEEVFATLFTEELQHIPNDPKLTADPVTCDVFLPTYIENKNVRIDWQSSDEASISSDGTLADVLKANTAVTLFATVYVNDSVFQTKFTFRVTSQTKETKFKYLVAQLNPVRLNKVYKTDADNRGEAFVYLPSVGGNYDYRTGYKSNTLTWVEETSAGVYKGFSDIGLVGLSYTVQNAYNFVSLYKDGNDTAIYLNAATFYTFAQVTVTGDFGNGEVYTENVNVLIELGQDSELYDLAFSNVEKKLSEVNILQNILDTRLKYGMQNERGDFYLESSYQSVAIAYKPLEPAGAVSATALETDETSAFCGWYHISVDSTKFSASESSAGIRVTLQIQGDENPPTRILYFNVPAVIKPDDRGFENYSVFSSVKYQTFTSLPEEERQQSTVSAEVEERLAALPKITAEYAAGFTVSGGTTKLLTNDTADYILVRDTQFVKKLSFAVGMTSGASDSHIAAYKLALLLDWATGSTEKELPFAIDGVDSSVKSNGKEYMNTEEVAAIKTYLIGTVKISPDDYATLWAQATRVPTGNAHVIENKTAVADQVKSMVGSNSTIYFKYTEVMQWALNQKRFNASTAGGSADHSPPNLGKIGINNVLMDGTGTTGRATTDSCTSTVLDWNSDPTKWEWHVYGENESQWKQSKYYKGANGVKYEDDGTDFISDYEAQCIMAFWWGVDSDSTYKTSAKTFAQKFMNSCIVPVFLDEDGAGDLLSAVYTKKGTASFTAGMTDGVPEISNLDFSTSAIDLFENVTTYQVYGKVSDGKLVLPAFLTTSAANNYFNRVTKMSADRKANKITTFVMQGAANTHTKLSLTNVDRLTGTANLDFSYNPGIDSVGDILNVRLQDLLYLDVHGVGAGTDYVEYLLKNVKVLAPDSVCYYTKDKVYTKYTVAAGATVSEGLRYLNELTKVDSPYLQLTKFAEGSTIQWYVEQGNPAYLVESPGNDVYTAVSSADAMNRLLKNYYYCNASVATTWSDGTTPLSLSAGSVYKLTYGGTRGYGFELVYSADELEAVNAVPGVDEVDMSQGTAITRRWQEQTGTSGSVAATGPKATSYTSLSALQNAYGSYEQVYSGSSTYLDLYTSKNSNFTEFASGVTGLYRVTETVTETKTYRYYIDNNVRSLSKNYYDKSTGKVINANFTKGSADVDYLTFTVNIARTYHYYFYKQSTPTVTFVNPTYNGTTYPYARIYTQQNTWCEIYNTAESTYYYTNENVYATYKTQNFAASGTMTYTQEQAYNAVVSYLDTLTDGTYTPDGTVDTTAASSVTTTDLVTYLSLVSSAEDVAGSNGAYAYIAATEDNLSLYKFTGSGSQEYYEEGTKYSGSYTTGGGYRLNYDTSQKKFVFNAVTLRENAPAVNMESILSEANAKKDTALFGNYYGNYYCYSGDTTSINGRSYVSGGLYRLMTDENGNFVFIRPADGKYGEDVTRPTSFITYVDTGTTANPIAAADNMMKDLLKAINGEAGAPTKGQVVYLKGTLGHTYAHGFFELTYDEDSLTYYFKSMGGLGCVEFTATDSYDISRITGQDLHLATDSAPSRMYNIRYVGTTGQKYGGTGGSRETIIVARVVENGTTYERKFKVTVSA